MPVKPDDYKLVCSKCGYSTIIKPTSDIDFTFPVCPKCKEFMDRKNLNSNYERFINKIDTTSPTKFK